LDSFELPKAKT